MESRERELVFARRLARAEDVGLALSFAAWGFALVAGPLVAPGAPTVPLVPRLATALLHGTAAWLFLRRPARTDPLGLSDIAWVLPSMLLSGVAFHLGAMQLGRLAQMVHASAALAAAISLLTLGTSFAVFPSTRGLVQGGPYRWVRHPAYAFELAMAGCCLAAAGTVAACGVAVALFAATAIRCELEERHLRRDPAYAAYAERVRFRLLPMVW